MADLTSLSIEEIFRLLESNNSDVVAEIQRFFHENLSETRESWLVSGLYDYYINTGSSNGMKLLANVREPHDKILCDRLSDCLRSGSHMSLSLDLMGYIVRKQPTWLHRVSNHQMFKELVKLIKTEMDVTILVPALLLLVSLLPIVAHKVKYLYKNKFVYVIKLRYPTSSRIYSKPFTASVSTSTKKNQICQNFLQHT